MGRAGAGEGMLEYVVVRCFRGTGGEGGGGLEWGILLSGGEEDAGE
jgi:hypothetical protein